MNEFDKLLNTISKQPSKNNKENGQLPFRYRSLSERRNWQRQQMIKKGNAVEIKVASLHSDFYTLLDKLDSPNLIAEYGCLPNRCVGENCYYCNTAYQHEFEQIISDVKFVQRHLRKNKISKMRLTQPDWCTAKRRAKKVYK